MRQKPAEKINSTTPINITKVRKIKLRINKMSKESLLVLISKKIIMLLDNQKLKNSIMVVINLI